MDTGKRDPPSGPRDPGFRPRGSYGAPWDWWSMHSRWGEHTFRTPEEYVDFHVRLEEQMRIEEQVMQRVQAQGGCTQHGGHGGGGEANPPGEDGDAGDTLLLEHLYGGPQ